MGRLGALTAKFWRVSNTRTPLRPAHTLYLRLPAQLLAYARGQLGVQAAPQQQRQGAEQEADTRGHVVAFPAARLRRVGAGGAQGSQPEVNGAGDPADAPALRRPRAEGRGPGARQGPDPARGAALRRSAGGRPAPAVPACGSPAQGPGRLGRKGGRRGREPGTAAPPTQLRRWKARRSWSLFRWLYCLAPRPPPPRGPALSPAACI